MACTIINGYAIDCRDSVGGIDKIYVAPFNDVMTITESSGVITAVTMQPGKKFWSFEMEKENAMLEEKENSNVENGTMFYEPSLKFTLKKLTAAKRNDMKVLAQNRLHVIVLDRNGLYWYLGRYAGMDKVNSSAKTGKAMGDLNGYEIELSGKEIQPMFNFTGTVPTT